MNAWSVAVPYDATLLEFVGISTDGVKDMENLTYDRLHKNGVKSLYPTFVNTGNKATLNGSGDLVIITFKARRNGKLSLEMKDMMLVDKKLNTIEK